jgi:SAM-dependent methyltransferase
VSDVHAPLRGDAAKARRVLKGALPQAPPGLLDDTTGRDYSRKLQLFSAFAEPELRQAIASLELERGMCVLDAGCGTGEALGWLADEVGQHGLVVGLDLAAAHASATHATARPGTAVLQADLCRPPLAAGSFDLVWAVNTINHLRDPLAGVKCLATLLRSGGRLALGQSALLPEMFFAWDGRLERLTNEAVRQYYRDRYRLEEHDLAGVRALLGWLRGAQLREVMVRTLVIERVAPLRAADQVYFLEAIFRGTWGERLRPYLSRDDYEELMHLCAPGDCRFALKRPDFHFLQTFTLAVGKA